VRSSPDHAIIIILTPYHAKLWASLLTLKGASGSIENLSRSIANARVDLNPHQVDAALFALRSPLSKGVLFADEVGLGKTIEAGIVLSQRWAERRRRILLIVPAILRKQWVLELREKFFLPAAVIDSGMFNAQRRAGVANPFSQKDKIVICSYQFAASKKAEIQQLSWDLVVIDEAHRLRNVFKPSSKLARAIADAVQPAPKLLLTATPLQNSLLELYGLVSVIDDHVFGDAATFRDQFIRVADDGLRNSGLKDRLKPICIRTLRKQVIEYVPFTRRVPITQEFMPGEEEHRLYESVSAFLQREKLFTLPASQRTLITLVLRKLLASSTFAIAGTLQGLLWRLQLLSESQELLNEDDIEGVDELADELAEAEGNEESDSAEIDEKVADAKLIKDELEELRRYADLAANISVNAKGERLLPALKVAFEKAEALGAAKKAVIFTESRRTQQYLFDLLSANGYSGRLVLMNGTNTDPLSKTVYQEWLRRHEGEEVVSGSVAVDMKAAIVEQFKDHADILIATEAAAEGVNLQFCSLVVNYDLPWNPQRIEQRIGRCHRYGQKHDVVVVNFLNKRNEADQRVYQLLSEKFKLFEGVFGSSDEVLGTVESGVDIERRIAEVYQTCRTSEEITAAFDRLQKELDEQIQSRMAETRRSLLETVDQEVADRLKVSQDRTVERLSNRERWLLSLTRFELDKEAEFDQVRPRFRYFGPSNANVRQGFYDFDWKEAEKQGDTFYRQDHPLAVKVIDRAIDRRLSVAALSFDYTGSKANISVLKQLVGESGWLEVSKLTVESLEAEEFLLFTAMADDGSPLSEDIGEKLFALPATQADAASDALPLSGLSSLRDLYVQRRLEEVGVRNTKFFDEEVSKLDLWSDDLKVGLEREIKELDKEIRDARRQSAVAIALKDKLEAQRHMKSLESSRNKKRRELFEAQDQIDRQRDELIGKLEQQLAQKHRVEPVFAVRFNVS
jgi:ERCC4-related helicase